MNVPITSSDVGLPPCEPQRIFSVPFPERVCLAVSALEARSA